jgi:DNA-binding IclR family transcriptional regulator
MLLAVSSHYLSTPLVDACSPYIAQLSKQTQCTGYISMLEGRNIMVMRMFPGRTYLQVVTPAGSLLPAAETAIGRAILARYTDREVTERYQEGYRVNSPNSPQTLEQLLTCLQEIRQKGWSAANNETLQGISTLATSVANKHRDEKVGICLSFPSPHESGDLPAEIRERIMAVTRQIAQKLGDEYWR